LVDLGVLQDSPVARAICNSGLVVGEGGGSTFQHGVLWDYDLNVVDLGALGGSNFSSALSVNSSGTVVRVSALRAKRLKPARTVMAVAGRSAMRLALLAQVQTC
jgi:hypothetical protein